MFGPKSVIAFPARVSAWSFSIYPAKPNGRSRKKSDSRSFRSDAERARDRDRYFPNPGGCDTSGFHMRMLDRLARWKESGAISKPQHDAIAGIVRKDRFSV